MATSRLCGLEADKSTPTSDFNGGVGGRSILEGVHARVHASIVSSGFAESAEERATCEPSGCQHTHTHTGARAHASHAHRPALGVSVGGARFWDLLSVLHPEALLVDTVHAGQVALQHENITFHRKYGVLGGADYRLCEGETHRVAPVK